jgi:hypothetical protein
MNEEHELPELTQWIFKIHGEFLKFRLRNMKIEFALDSSNGLQWFPLCNISIPMETSVKEWIKEKLLYRAKNEPR